MPELQRQATICACAQEDFKSAQDDFKSAQEDFKRTCPVSCESEHTAGSEATKTWVGLKPS